MSKDFLFFYNGKGKGKGKGKSRKVVNYNFQLSKYAVIFVRERMVNDEKSAYIFIY